MKNEREGGEKKGKSSMGEEIVDLVKGTSIYQETPSGIKIFSTDGGKSGDISFKIEKQKKGGVL